MDILKVPGKVRTKRNFFARQFLYGNIESVWDSAVATNTFFQALFMEKVPGKVRKRRTLFCMEGISAGGAQVQLNCTKSAKLSMN